MYITTLTAFFAILAIFAVIITRPEARAGGGRAGQSYQISQCGPSNAVTGPRIESLPRLSRNHWERRDLTRMLMTEDDYTGRITPQPARPKSDSTV